MLTIRQMSSGAYLDPMGTGARVHLGPLGLDGKPAPAVRHNQTIPIGRITTSKEKTLGDRNCHHDNLEGVLFVDTNYDRPFIPTNQNSPIKDRICTDPTGTTLRYNYICNYNESITRIGVWKFVNTPTTQVACADITAAAWTPQYAFTAYKDLVLSNPAKDLSRFLANYRSGKWDYEKIKSSSMTVSLFVPTDTNNWFSGGTVYKPAASYINALDLQKEGPEALSARLYAERYTKCTARRVYATTQPLWLSLPAMEKKDSYQLRRLANTLFNIVPNPLSAGHPHDVWGALTCRIVDKSKAVDINSIAFLADLAKIRDLIPPIPKGTTGVLNPKYLSKVFLWWKYGVENTYRDVCAISKSLKARRQSIVSELPYNTLRSSIKDVGENEFGPVSREYHAKLLYGRYPNYVMEARTHLDSLALYPDLSRSWDLVPFSFVVDWVLPIGDILDKADKWTDVQYFDVWSYTKSYKLSSTSNLYSIVVAGLTLSGSITRIVYDRRSQRYLDVPKLEAEYPNVDPSKHWAESLALLISVKR